MEANQVREWAEAYRRAWEDADSEAAAALFTEDATYRNDIYQEPNRGRSGVIDYWAGVTAAQSGVTVRMGRPFMDGNRAVIEFWTTMNVEDTPVTLGGALLLRFEETGLCSSLREYYAFTDGNIDPPPEWGT